MSTTPTVTLYTMLDPDDPKIVISDNQTGHCLTCAKCKLSNCEHIASVLNDNLDTYIFDLDSFSVPLSLPLGLWIPLTLGEDLRARGVARQLSIHGSATFWDATRAGGLAPLPNRDLGFLIKGEGRRVIRNTLAAWLKGWALETKPICCSTMHGPKEEAALAAADTQTRLAILWHILTTGTCLYCNSVLDHMDDLIPMAPNNRMPW